MNYKYVKRSVHTIAISFADESYTSVFPIRWQLQGGRMQLPLISRSGSTKNPKFCVSQEGNLVTEFKSDLTVSLVCVVAVVVVNVLVIVVAVHVVVVNVVVVVVNVGLIVLNWRGDVSVDGGRRYSEITNGQRPIF